MVIAALVTDTMVAFLLALEELKDLRLDHRVLMPKQVPRQVHNNNHKTALHQLQYVFFAQYANTVITCHFQNLGITVWVS